jgi:hypothetical protein
MIDTERQIAVCNVLGWGIERRLDDSWMVVDRSKGREINYTRLGNKGFPSRDTAIMACWSFVLKEHDLYLHKKGGIYRKQDERLVHDTDITVVNYEHIHPHERAPGCRTKSEWETPGRFVKITL